MADGYDEGLLRQSHRALESVGRIVSSIRDNNLGEAERAITAARQILDALAKQVGDKARSEMQVPNPDPRDRG